MMMPLLTEMEQSSPQWDYRAKETLRQHHLRMTAPRMDVLALFMEKDAPYSHADVVEALANKPHDRATLYRNLLTLEEAGILTRHHFGDNVWRFTLSPQHSPEHHGHSEDEQCCSDKNPHRHHPHFVCTECHSVECYTLGIDLATVLGANNRDLPFIEEMILRGKCIHCR
jgi:Fur family transcriptional regulator, ferric uptake regulator